MPTCPASAVAPFRAPPRVIYTTAVNTVRPGERPRSARLDALDWPALYERHGPELSAFVFRLVRDGGVTQDIVQDTFTRAIERQSTLRDPGAVRAWLYRIAANLVASTRRRRSLLVFVPFLGSERAPERDADTAALVRTALARIPADQAIALTLAYHDGFTRAEIADLLHVPEETVRSRIARGRKNFGASYQRLQRGLAG